MPSEDDGMDEAVIDANQAIDDAIDALEREADDTWGLGGWVVEWDWESASGVTDNKVLLTIAAKVKTHD